MLLQEATQFKRVLNRELSILRMRIVDTEVGRQRQNQPTNCSWTGLMRALAASYREGESLAVSGFIVLSSTQT
jgi:hypothetical protein